MQDDTPKKVPGKNLFAPDFAPEKTDSLSHQGRKELSSEMEDRYRNRSSSGESNESLRRNRLRDFDYSARREERDYDAARRGGHAHFAYASHRNIPKLKLREFNGDPLEWPEWSGMFLATIDSSPLTNDEKMSHLKSLVTGKAKRAIMGLGFSGAMYNQAWQTLQKKFGQSHLIVSSQLSKIQGVAPIGISILLMPLHHLSEYCNSLDTLMICSHLVTWIQLSINCLMKPDEDGLLILRVQRELGNCQI